jgi:hypothetical protein
VVTATIIEFEIHGCDRLRLTIVHPAARCMLGGVALRADGAVVAAPAMTQTAVHRQAAALRPAVITKNYAQL